MYKRCLHWAATGVCRILISISLSTIDVLLRPGRQRLPQDPSSDNPQRYTGRGDSYPTHLRSCRRRGDMKWGISWYQLCSGDQLMAHICAAYINHLRPWWEMVHIICPRSRPGFDMGKPLKRADIRACMGLLRRILRNIRRDRTPPGTFSLRKVNRE
jgi:hypothetical protein